MSKEEMESEVDRYLVMSQEELEAHIIDELNKPGAYELACKALEDLKEALENGTLTLKA